jgi:transposase
MKKAVIGIDVSSKEFHVCFLTKDGENRTKVVATRKFKNSETGVEEMIRWVEKHNKSSLGVTYVMEATGCYYENLAYQLYENCENVCVVLANKMKNYFKSFNVKTKTDKVDAKVIARYGAERAPEPWVPMSEDYKSIRDLCRELLSQKKELNRAKNQLHAINYSHKKAEVVKKIKREQIELYEKSIGLIRQEIRALVEADETLKAKIDKLQTIPCIGFETAILLVSETNGFKLFKNIRQVVSYAGLDVSHNESGAYRGRSKISKKGNSRMRQALFMPAMSATVHNPSIKNLHRRICERNPNIKRKGVVASMRKLLVFAYVLWKKDETFDINHKWAA